MLRVSSLGPLRYHDTSRIPSFRLHRFLSKAARKASETGEPHYTNSHEDPNLRNDLRSARSGHVNSTPAVPESSRGRRRAVIPPLQIEKGGAKAANLAQSVDMQASIKPKTSLDWALWSQNEPSSGSLVSSPEYQAQGSMASQLEDTDTPPYLGNGRRKHLENVMASTTSVTEAWDAYQELTLHPHCSDLPPIKYSHLHRLTRLLTSTRPRTRLLLLRLLSVLATLHKTGGIIHLWEWNALIDMAGKGWRKTRLEDFQAALDVYHDMTAQRSPGASLYRGEGVSSVQGSPSGRHVVNPDIVTYTTLLNIAGRTLDIATVRHATNILEGSKLPKNRMVHLVLLRFFTRKDDLMGVRATLLKMREQGFELGLDGINACVWAYARNGRVDVAMLIYRILRYRLMPGDEMEEQEIKIAVRQLAASEGLTIPTDLKPDAITYYTLIQCYAYHGDLVKCLTVFMDMMKMDRSSVFLYRRDTPNNPSGTEGLPTLPAFRAIFLGFARHGKVARRLLSAGPMTNRVASSPWTLLNLEALFDSFMKSPHDAKPSERTIYWILVAFDTWNQDGNARLRKVWEKLEGRFGGGWGGRVEEFRKRIYEDEQ